MKGQKCANCGYELSAAEAIMLNIGKVFGDVAGKTLPQQRAMVTNTISNITRLKCPKCGQTGRWI